MGVISASRHVDGGVPVTPVSRHPLLHRAPLDVGLGEVGAIDFNVDLGVCLLLLLLLLQRPPVADEVERQQVSCGAESQQPNVDLEEGVPISKAYRFELVGVYFYRSICVCVLTQNGSPCRGPIMARKRGCCSRANTALTRDCMPVRLPNWEEGKLDVGTAGTTLACLFVGVKFDTQGAVLHKGRRLTQQRRGRRPRSE